MIPPRSWQRIDAAGKIDGMAGDPQYEAAPSRGAASARPIDSGCSWSQSGAKATGLNGSLAEGSIAAGGDQAGRDAGSDEASDSRDRCRPTPNGRVFVGKGPRPGALAMLFPGQGSQYVGMLRELACLFPRMQASLSRMNEAAGDETGTVSDRIYPPAAFDNAGGQAREAALRDTGFAQPAIGAVSLGLLRIFEEFGVRPDLVGGHSFGELTALCAAGRIDDGVAWRCSPIDEGQFMARCAASVGRAPCSPSSPRSTRSRPWSVRMAWIWSSPTRMRPGNVCSRARPRRSSGAGGSWRIGG